VGGLNCGWPTALGGLQPKTARHAWPLMQAPGLRLEACRITCVGQRLVDDA
jgi:hypothetical protein